MARHFYRRLEMKTAAGMMMMVTYDCMITRQGNIQKTYRHTNEDIKLKSSFNFLLSTFPWKKGHCLKH